MSTPPRRLSAPSALAAMTVGAVALALLTGCVPSSDDEPTAAPTESSTSAPEPTSTPTSAPVGTPIDVSCDDLVSADTLYVYNPNFSSAGDFTPDAGSAAADAVSYQGVACRWVNATSGETIDLSVARLDTSTLTDLKNDAFATSEAVPTYGDEAYFSLDGDVGTATVFQGDYWLVATSVYFFEPGDAVEIVDAALAALPA